MHASIVTMRAYVDADACPVTREVVRVARRHRVTVVMVGNATQNLSRWRGERGIEVIEVGSGPDAADFAMAPLLEPGDVVVTADIGLAAMALGRGAAALTPRGKEFHNATIDAELAVRHAERRHRRAGGRTKGPPPFTADDRERFEAALERALSRGRKG